MENFGLDVKIEGKPVEEYISCQMEKLEKMEIQMEKEKIKNSYLKQLNNRSRLSIDAAKFMQKKAEFELAQKV